MAHPSLRIAVDEIPERGFKLQIDHRHPSVQQLLWSLDEGKGDTAQARVQLELEKWPDRVDLNGQVEGQVVLVCARCTDSYVQAVKHRFTHHFLREAPLGGSGDEVELNSEDLERSILDGKTINLLSTVEEELRLALPVKPLCMEACQGLCSGCGAELNNEPCSCKPEVDDRWAALQGLKLD